MKFDYGLDLVDSTVNRQEFIDRAAVVPDMYPHAVVVDTREIELVRRQTVLINMKISVISLRMDFDLQRDYVL